MRLLIAFVAAAAMLAACKSETEAPKAEAAKAQAVTPAPAPAAAAADVNKFGPAAVTLPNGLKFEDLKVGDGPTPQAGQTVTVNYTGWLQDGKKFDSSFDRNQPFKFQVGRGMVIRGWDEVVLLMKVGGTRKVLIPPDLAYGQRGAGGVIPPGATLIFQIDLISAQ